MSVGRLNIEDAMIEYYCSVCDGSFYLKEEDLEEEGLSELQCPWRGHTALIEIGEEE